METTALLLAALLALFRPPADIRARLALHHDHIVQVATAAAAHHDVPVGVLLVVGLSESHLGEDHGEGGNWGAPISPTRRHTAGTPDHAARALASGFRHCHTWLGAVAWFRSGACRPQHTIGYSAPFAIRTVERVYRRAGLELPLDLH